MTLQVSIDVGTDVDSTGAGAEPPRAGDFQFADRG